jgi:hypothetical protein
MTCVADAEVSVSFVVKVTALLCMLTACICLMSKRASVGAVNTDVSSVLAKVNP